ncbi:resolvase [Cyanobium sp. Alchichica 3B3-8F6]|uniref:resolvase n=1 Tax=Cyanobium sp. Alchichica 3B3-8F6 TaxID=2823696 RepID=UPI0020CEFD12|nr:resolvase [Cyanobium sp. Alchichica 3B3-8F6]MCP9881833.1 resolvase [Cyanobium sp. Alchichica 3B3-8F6]
MTAGLIAGLDPGRSKCGLVLADLAQALVLEAAILPPEASRAQLQAWQRQGLTRVVVGNGTSSSAWRGPLAALALELELVDEHGSTLAARDRYWELYPANGWWRLLPAGLRLPRRDIDDVVAQLLVERHSGLRLQRPTQEVRRCLQGLKSEPAP